MWETCQLFVPAFETSKGFGFGRLKLDNVVIRNRKDNIGACYAFVECEDFFFWYPEYSQGIYCTDC